MKYKLLAITFAAALLCSCGTTYNNPSTYIPQTRSNQFEMNKSTFASNYKIFQTLNKNFGLAEAQTGNMIIAIRTLPDSEPMYDGKVISAYMVMIDTYTYETVPDFKGQTKVKTVPLVMPKNDYIKMKATENNRDDN